MADARMDVEIGSDKAASGSAAVVRAVDGIKTSFFGLNLSMNAVTQNIQTAVRLIEQTWASAKIGAQFEETMGRLNRQMGGFHSNARSMVSDLQLISSGTLGMSDAATMASRAIATGLDPNQVLTFTKAAMLLKDVMGTSLPQAFDQMVTAAVGGRGAILRNIGIFVDMDEEIRKLAVSTGRTTDRITQQEKAMLMQAAVAGKVEAASKKMTDGMVSDSARLEQVEARFANLWTTIAQGANFAVQKAMLGLGSLLDYIEKHQGLFFPGQGLRNQLGGGKPTEFIQVAPRTYGKGGGGGETIPESSAMQRDRIRNAADIQLLILHGEEHRRQASLQAEKAMLDADLAMQTRFAVDVVTLKGQLDRQDLEEHLKLLQGERVKEAASYAEQKKIIGNSIQEDIALEKDHLTKVTENAIAIRGVKHAMGLQERQDAKDTAVAVYESFKTTGDEMVRQYKENFDVMQAVRQVDMNDIEAYYQAEVESGISRYASDAEMAAKERVLLRDQMAFKLQLTQEETDRILFIRNSGDIEGAMNIARRSPTALKEKALEAVVESGAGKDIRLAERANNSFFAGWSRGLQKYAQDRDSAFGMSTDMARRTAQAMEQGFQTMFFDSMEGKFTQFKDVLSGVLDFTKKIISQIMAQMVTIGIINPAAAGLANFFGASATTVPAAQNYGTTNFFAERFGPGFASGGSFRVGGSGGTDSQRVGFMATPGEQVNVTRPGEGGGQVNVQIINQVPQAEVTVQRGGSSGNNKNELLILVAKAMNDNIGQGRVDKSMKSRFNLSPGNG